MRSWRTVGAMALAMVIAGASASSAAASNGDVTCAGAFAGIAPHDLIVPPNMACVMSGATVRHDVIVQQGASLTDRQSSVGHDIRADQPSGIGIGGGGPGLPGSVKHDVRVTGVTGRGPGIVNGDNYVCNTSIGHDLTIQGSLATAGLWDIGDIGTIHGMTSDCAEGAVTVGHDMQVLDNANAIDVSDNSPPHGDIGHDLQVIDNSGPLTSITRNHAGHDADCRNNTGFVGAGNTAGHRNSCG